MSISDWTLVTDGTAKKYLTSMALSGSYTARLSQSSGSSNYATFLKNNTIGTIDNVKVESICNMQPDYINSPDYYTPVTWTLTGQTANYDASANTLTRKGSTGITYTVVDNAHAINRVGVGVKFKMNSILPTTVAANAGQSSILIGLYNGASSTPSSNMTIALVLSYSNLGGVPGYYVWVLEQSAKKYGSYAYQYLQFHDCWFVTPNDFLSIEINSSLHYEYKINGITFYTSALTWSTSLYIHATMYSATDSLTAWVDNTSNTKTDKNVYPIIVTRLQSLSQGAECYTLKYNIDKSVSLTKGSLNTATPTLLSTSASLQNVAAMGTSILSLQTTTLQNSVYNTVSQKSIPFFENYLTTGVSDTNLVKRRGQPVGLGTPLIVNGKFNKAVSFDGYSGMSALSSDITTLWPKVVEMWIYPKRVDSGVILRYDYTYSNTNLFFVKGKLVVGTACSNGDAPDSLAYGFAASSTTLSINRWYHITAVFSNTSAIAYLYINGVLEATTPALSYSAMQSNSNYNFLIGCGRDAFSNVTGSYYVGLIDSFQLTSNTTLTAPTASEVYARYVSQAAGTEPTVWDITYAKMLYKFEDAYQSIDIINHADTDTPILQPGYAGVGIYSPQAVYGGANFDDTTLYIQS